MGKMGAVMGSTIFYAIIVPIIIAALYRFYYTKQGTESTLITGNWFKEWESPMWPGQGLSLKINKILHQERSKFQDVLVFESTNYGNVLILDGVIQVTERDEFSYQEMLAHLAMNSHPNPKNVLVVGGGDGGILREVLKHPSVESVTLCEIDEAVVRVSKLYLPHMAIAMKNPKVEIVIDDGAAFLKNYTNSFDVIITDSSDPIGPASVLYEASYFELMKGSLKEKGVISIQGECFWLHLELISKVMKYASPSIHEAAFVLPHFVEVELNQ